MARHLSFSFLYLQPSVSLHSLFDSSEHEKALQPAVLYAQPAVFLQVFLASPEHASPPAGVVVVVVGLGVGSALHCLFSYSQPSVFSHVLRFSPEHEKALHVSDLYAQPAVFLQVFLASPEHASPPPDEEQVSPSRRSQQPVVPHGATRLLPELT